MNRGPKPISQDAILAALLERPGELIETRELIHRVFGPGEPKGSAAFRQALGRLRKRLPGLEIETVTGYRIRRPSP